MKSFKWLLLFAMGFGITACCSCRQNASKSATPLIETKWVLSQLNGKLVEPNGNYYLIIGKESGRYNGRGDCNGVMGSYTMTGPSITFGAGAATRMMCPNQSTEDEFLKMLVDTNKYEIDGQTLMFFKGDELLAIFHATAEVSE